ASFHDLHRRAYGHDNRAEPVEIVNLRVTASGSMPPLVIRQRPATAGSDAIKARRCAFFRGRGAVETVVYERACMPAGLAVGGPAVIESLESTPLVPPGWRASMDGDGFLRLVRVQDGGSDER